MVGIDTKSTAVLIIDPQNDFLSEGGAVWDLVGKGVRETKVVEHLIEITKTAKEAGIPVFYSLCLSSIFVSPVQKLLSPL